MPVVVTIRRSERLQAKSTVPVVDASKVEFFQTCLDMPYPEAVIAANASKLTADALYRVWWEASQARS